MEKDRPLTREEATLGVDGELIFAREKARLEGDYATVVDIDCYWLLDLHSLDCI
jgi:hypothetical protein